MSGAEFIVVLGVAASAIQVIEACKKVSDRIRDFRENRIFEELHNQLHLFIRDIQILSDDHYRERLDSETEKALVRVLGGCDRTLHELDTLIALLRPSLLPKGLARAWMIIKGLGKDRKMRELMSVLEGYRATITLHFTSQIAQGQLNDAGAGERQQTQHHIIPRNATARFIGRDSILHRIEAAVTTSMTSPAVVILHGMAGIGKTQIALEYGRRHSDTYSMIFWIDASSRMSVIQGFESVAASISEPSKQFRDSMAKVDFVMTSLGNSPKPWLLVFDNHDNPNEDITCFFPTSLAENRNAILITSQNRPSSLSIAVPVEGFDEDEGLEMLRSRAVLSSDSSEEEVREAKRILSTLGYLPLAIDQAASYISIRQLPLSNFLSHFETRKQEILGRPIDGPWGYRRTDSDSPNLSVLTTWELSFGQIAEDESEKLCIEGFLTQAAFFNPAQIGENLFRNFVMYRYSGDDKVPVWLGFFNEDGSETWDSFKFQDVVCRLLNLSLIQSVDYDGDEISFSLHPLVKDWLQLRRNGDVCRYAIFANCLVANLVLTTDRDKISFRDRQQILSHIEVCLSSENWKCKDSKYSNSEYPLGMIEEYQETFASFLSQHDRLSEAKSLHISVLERQYKLPHGLRAALHTANNLGALYLELRELDKAEEMLRPTMHATRKLLGPTHVLTLSTLTNMGILYMMKSMFEKATQMYQQSLEGYTDLYGASHKNAVQALNKLGEVALKKGDFPEAEELFSKALDRVQSNTSEDALTLYIKSNVAFAHAYQARYDMAIQLLEEVVKGREALLGPAHSSTLISVFELANVYLAVGRQDEARELFDRAKMSGVRRASKHVPDDVDGHFTATSDSKFDRMTREAYERNGFSL